MDPGDESTYLIKTTLKLLFNSLYYWNEGYSMLRNFMERKWIHFNSEEFKSEREE